MLKSIVTIIILAVSLILPNYSYSKDFFDIGVAYPYGPMELTGFTLFGFGNKEMRLNLNNNPSHTGSLLIGKYGDKTVLDPKYVKEGVEYLVRAIFILYTDRSLEIYRDEVERYGIHIYRKVRWNTEDTWYKTPVIYTGSVEDSVGGVHGILGEVDFLDMKMYTVTNEDGYTFFVGGKFAFDQEKDNILSDSELVDREVVVYGHMHRLYDDTRVFDTNKPIKIFALVSNHADDSTSK